MFGRSSPLPHIGPLQCGWGKWYGWLPIPGLDGPLELWIEVPRREPLESFAQQAAPFAECFSAIREGFASELYETYNFYRQTDIETSGGYSAADYARHPAVTSPAEVWRVLPPLPPPVGPTIDPYVGNSYLTVDVDWPNPHYFQIFMEASNSEFKYMHTEFVGSLTIGRSQTEAQLEERDSLKSHAGTRRRREF